MTLNEYQKHPTLTSEGKPWTQRCYVCDKSINLLKDPAVKRVKVGELVRHKKCFGRGCQSRGENYEITWIGCLS